MLVRSYLLQLLVAFFMGRKSSTACAAWCAEACVHLSNLSFALCGSKPSSEVTPYSLKHLLLSSGRPVTARKTREKFREKERKKTEKICEKKLVAKFRKNSEKRIEHGRTFLTIL